MCTSKWLFLLLLKIKLLQDLKGVICLRPNLINWLSQFLLYGNSGHKIRVCAHCRVRLCNSLQFRLYFSTCKRMWCPHNCREWNQWCCSQSVLIELSCLYLWSPGWLLKVLFKWHSYVFHERAPTNFFFFSRNEGRWDQGILLCADTSQGRQAVALGIHGSQAWSLEENLRLAWKSSGQHETGWRREEKTCIFLLHLSLKNG